VGNVVDFTIGVYVGDLRAPPPSAAAERLAPVFRDLELSLATAKNRLRKAVERAVLGDRQRLAAMAGRLRDPRRPLAQKRLQLSEESDRLERAMAIKVRALRERHKVLTDRLARRRPQARISEARERIAKLRVRLMAAGRGLMAQHRSQLHVRRIAFERAAPRTLVRRLRAELSSRVAALDALSPLKVMARGYAVVFRQQDGHLVRRAEEVRAGDEISVRLLGTGCTTLSECEEIDAQVTQVRGTPKPS
jgi:exodeoxyribonuclease VII large subunit